jgi:hypothetical protein
MSNARYNQIIDEVYETYLKGGDIKWLKQVDVSSTPLVSMVIPIPYSKNEFINKCKTNQEFSERWGLKIEERELSSVERWEWYGKNGGPNGEILYIDMIVYQNEEDNLHIKSWLEKWAPNVPTKQITVEYNEEKVEGYE